MSPTFIAMLSTNSLSAFSAATTTAPVASARNVRLVREPVSPTQPTKNAVPNTQPFVAPPRGSLLNLSV